MGVFLPTSPVFHRGYLSAKPIRLHQLFNAVERIADFLTVIAAFHLAGTLYWLSTGRKWEHYSNSELLVAGAAYSFLFVVLLERHGEYRPYMSLLWVRETERLLRVMFQSFICALLAGYWLAVPSPRLALPFALFTIPGMLMLEKGATRKAVRHMRSKGYGTRKAIILGTGSLGRQIYSVLARSAKFGLDPIGFVAEDPHEWGREIYECSYQRKAPVRVFAGQPTPGLLKQLGASVLMVATPELSQDGILEIVARFSNEGIAVYFTPAESFEPGVRIEYSEMDGILLGHGSGETARSIYETGKRVLDIGISAALLVPLAPVLAMLALLVKATSPGPIIFRQKRVGKNGKIFTMFKFRSMVTDTASYALSPIAGEDPRITPFGRFLRRTGLDELPQFINVLLGHMSLVGPRPEMPFIAEEYSAEFRERLKVKPGMTGLWQLSADRAFLIHQNIEYDLYYLFNNPRFVWHSFLQLGGMSDFEIEN